MIRNSIILVFGLLCCAALSFGQKNIAGSYYNKFGLQIKIEDKKCLFIYPYSESKIYYNDTLADCSIKRVDENFFEINSVSPLSILDDGLNISYGFDNSIKDSVRITFLLPYDGRLTISIGNMNSSLDKKYVLEYTESNNQIMLPQTSYSYVYSIEPSSIQTHSFDVLEYGITCIAPLVCPIKRGSNVIEISMPRLDNAFFEKFYFKGEYVRIKNNRIFWKGDVFVKQ